MFPLTVQLITNYLTFVYSLKTWTDYCIVFPLSLIMYVGVLFILIPVDTIYVVYVVIAFVHSVLVVLLNFLPLPSSYTPLCAVFLMVLLPLVCFSSVGAALDSSVSTNGGRRHVFSTSCMCADCRLHGHMLYRHSNPLR